MKSLKMLMMAASSILTISVFAQSNTTLSKKEQMKMEVMKIYASPAQNGIINYIGKNPKSEFASNLSPKEQMKINVMKGYTGTGNQDIAIDKSGTCPLCVTLLNGAPKEQMKMKVMGLYDCPMSLDMASDQPGKCSMCGMDLTSVKSK